MNPRQRPPEHTGAGVTRRRALGVGIAAIGVGTLGACGDDDDEPTAAGPVAVGAVDELIAGVRENDGPLVRADLRAYVVEVDDTHRAALAAAWDDARVAGPILDHGLILLRDKCPHQGCRVPACGSNGWFECPCHGSRFGPYGELRRGPANRGLSALPLVIDEDGTVTVVDSPVDGTDLDPIAAPEPDDHCR